MQDPTSPFLSNDPLWFKDAIIYEVPVRAFADSDKDGIGDFRGLTEKLDYIQDLGVTAVWVLPFFPSPLRDDGYDISDYYSVNPIYGNLDDFREFLEAAHDRGIRVIIELIVNHTSDQHPWFQRARRAEPGTSARDFYVWSDTALKYPDVRIIFKDFETSNWTWDSVANAYYWHRFYAHQPDLNYDNLEVQKAIFDVMDFWLELGVDGLRLDAVPYLYERDGTNCENLAETHNILKKLRAHIDEHFPNRMLLAEANQWPEDAVAYYDKGDECHMNFHFPLMPRLFMSLQMEDSFPIIDILQQTPPIPDNCQWALFLRNHDELTLEMVSDEDRDYMYRVYAQDPQARINLGIRRRLAPLLGNDRRRIELLNALLMSLPGTPVLYYGDEVGMGDNFYLGDRHGVRTPMQWSADRNAGFSAANPQKLYAPVIVDPEYNYETINVEAQRSNPNSLWWWMKRLIATRSRFQAFGRGTFEFLHPENRKVLAFTRTYQGEHILVVVNLSRFVQTVELSLTGFAGMVPLEIFGQARFPEITDQNYFLSLSPYGFYWFTLEPVQAEVTLATPWLAPTVKVSGHWKNVFTKPESTIALAAILPDYLHTCPWFVGHARGIQVVTVVEVIECAILDPSLPAAPCHLLVMVTVDYVEGLPETYLLSLSYLNLEAGGEPPAQTVVQLRGRGVNGALLEALGQTDFLQIPLQAIAQKSRFKGLFGQVVAIQTSAFEELCGGLMTREQAAREQAAREQAARDQTPELASSLPARLLGGDHSNATVVYGDRLILKLFRRVEEGLNPDLELGLYLTRQAEKQSQSSPSQTYADARFSPIAGSLEYRRRGKETIVLGQLQRFVPDIRDAWSLSLDNLRDCFDRVLAMDVELSDIATAPTPAIAAQAEIPALAQEIMGTYLSTMALLGQRTAELHRTLTLEPENPAFAPESFSSFDQRSVYQSMRNAAGQCLIRLKKQLPTLPHELQPTAQTLLNHREVLMSRFKALLDLKMTSLRIRCHGDYHLRQVLYTGKDFILIDFEGDPLRPLSERRMKRSPLRDVAEMLQSIYCASQEALHKEVETGLIRPESLPLMEQWTQFFYTWTSAAFLKAYLSTATETPAETAFAAFLPKDAKELQVLLEAYLLEESISALGDALGSAPEQAGLLMRRSLQLLDAAKIAAYGPA